MVFKTHDFRFLLQVTFISMLALFLYVQSGYVSFGNLHKAPEQNEDTTKLTKQYLERLLSNRKQFRLIEKEKYSRVDCIQDPDQVPRCLFSNIGFVDQSIVFYENPLEPVTFIQSGLKYEFPSEFLRIRSGAVRKNPYCKPDYNTHFVPVIKVQDPIPEDAQYVPNTLMYLMNPFWPENQGHWLMDDLFASFVNLLEWGMYSDQFQYVITKGCNGYFPDYGNENQENRNCREFYLHRTKGISKAAPLFLTENIYPPTSEEYLHNQNQIESYQKGTLYFQNVLMGQSTFSFCETSIRNAFHWDLFRSVFLENTNISVPNIEKQQITIIKKTGRRNIVNYDEVVEWLQDVGLEVVTLNPLELPWEDQLLILAKTTVLVSVPGGVSFISGFVQPQAVGLIFDGWTYQNQTSFPLEGFWWESLSAFKFIRYTYDQSEAEFSSALFNHEEISDEIRRGCGIVEEQITEKELECIGKQYTNIKVEYFHFMQIICEALILAKQRFKLSIDTVPRMCIPKE
jgi:hypothetical protein